MNVRFSIGKLVSCIGSFNSDLKSLRLLNLRVVLIYKNAVTLASRVMRPASWVEILLYSSSSAGNVSFRDLDLACHAPVWPRLSTTSLRTCSLRCAPRSALSMKARVWFSRLKTYVSLTEYRILCWGS